MIALKIEFLQILHFKFLKNINCLMLLIKLKENLRINNNFKIN